VHLTGIAAIEIALAAYRDQFFSAVLTVVGRGYLVPKCGAGHYQNYATKLRR
jgi:hypothetical protein